ncbi:hypothetical protein HPP92_011237 [Vanilla planifolia]|uniref:Uncharacterized protein n=1 Tax=Vanilla planifolia TaxID=51239 RepID=A0A835RB43_VANPL|nr:hypothetical protein HPP92_011237 [Vanilla planifolia]
MNVPLITTSSKHQHKFTFPPPMEKKPPSTVYARMPSLPREAQMARKSSVSPTHVRQPDEAAAAATVPSPPPAFPPPGNLKFPPHSKISLSLQNFPHSIVFGFG